MASNLRGEELAERISGLLGNALGAFQFVRTRGSALEAPGGFWGSPVWVGLAVGLIYACLFCGLPWLVDDEWGPTTSRKTLFWLSVYGSCWSVWATIFARMTSRSISTTIKNDLIPVLSDRTVGMIDKYLARVYSPRRLLLFPTVGAFVTTLIAGGAIRHDVPSASYIEILWWSVGWFLILITAASTMYSATFYRSFSIHLESEREQLYVMDPARSTIVKIVASIGRRVLIFWVLVAVGIALVIPFLFIFSVDPPTITSQSTGYFGLLSDLFAFKSNLFVVSIVPITAFFSIGVGAVVFLLSEHAIRSGVDCALRSTLRSIELELAELFSRRSQLDQVQWQRLKRLSSLHKQLATAGSYRSAVSSGFSILAPLAPLVSSAASLFFHKP
jgi:hypothetical protein